MHTETKILKYIMLIVNPLYDQAFKLLMENNKIAKKIISTIIEKEIVSLQLKPQEVSIIDKKRNFPILRYDFKAVIKSENEDERVVLIEVQKSKSPDPIMRFRRYLASNYMKEEIITDKNGKETEKALPIITIYFLGYNLPEYNTPAIIVNNCVIDAVTKEPLEKKCEFVELLTHPSYILQVERLPEQRKSKLEKLLSLFDQARKTSDKYILDIGEEYYENNEDFNDIAVYLNRAAQNEQTRLELQLEEDVEKEFEKQEKLFEQIKENEELLKQNKKEIKQKKQQIEQKEQQIEQKEQQIEQKEQALKNSAKAMLQSGLSIEQVQEITKLSKELLERLK